MKSLLQRLEDAINLDPWSFLGKDIDLSESQKCERCQSDNLCHKSGTLYNGESVEWAHCQNCGKDQDIDYDRPF